MQITEQSAKQNLGIEPAPHLHAPMSTEKIMLIVIMSLIPALAVMTYFFGFGTLIQFVIAGLTALICQVLVALMRLRSVKRALKDPSGLVTALLLALTLPQLLPWYYTLIATLFAMLLVRECFGGLGQNLFNPAMSGFIFLVISAPGVFYSTWITPTPNAISVASPMRSFDVIVLGEDPVVLIDEIKELNRINEQEAALEKSKTLSLAQDAKHNQEGHQDEPMLNYSPEAILNGHLTTDGITGATYLESIKTARKAGGVSNHLPVDLMSPSFMAYVYLAAAYALGGLALILTRVIHFQVPLAFLGAMAVASAAWYHLDPSATINVLEHLVMGGTMLGAFYIITDPVTTCGTFKGRILLSAIIGLLVIVIRVHGSYSDSVAFAVMLGNCLAPLMDVMTKRRPFGIGYRPGGLD